jgi:hypothetical protein
VEVTFLGSKRLVLQCKVLNTNIVRSALPYISDGILDDLHLTVFHIGKSLDLFSEVSATAGVALDVYETRIVAYLRACVERSRSMYQGQVIASDVLRNDDRSYAVIKIAPEPALLDLRKWCRDSFLAMLQQNGIHNPENFMRGSSAIGQHSPEWLPHVTLSAGPPDGTVGKNLVRNTLEFGHLHVRRSA